jgi:tetratricopeptide (TPR) repeat protein
MALGSQTSAQTLAKPNALPDATVAEARAQLAEVETSHGATHTKTSVALQAVGNAHIALGQLAEAEGLYRRALTIAERHVKDDPFDAGNILLRLAALNFNMKRLDQAEFFARRSLNVYEEMPNPSVARVAASLNQLADIYLTQRRLSDAEPLLKRALPLMEETLPPAHPVLAIPLINLAGIYSEQRRYAESEAAFARALPITEKGQSPQFPRDLVAVLDGLAAVTRAQGRATEADAFAARAKLAAGSPRLPAAGKP